MRVSLSIDEDDFVFDKDVKPRHILSTTTDNDGIVFYTSYEYNSGEEDLTWMKLMKQLFQVVESHYSYPLDVEKLVEELKKKDNE